MKTLMLTFIDDETIIIRNIKNKEFRERLMYWYEKKCTLKNVNGKEYEYSKSKNMLNSSFGMTIQKLAIDEITYTDKWEESKKELKEVLEFYYKSKNSFLIKQQGIYVTAHARRRLQEGINICGVDYVYEDTDSWFVWGRNLPRLEIVSNSMDKALEKARQIDEKYKACQLKDIKLMDLTIGRYGLIDVWDFGFFEECARMSGNTFKDEDYTIIDGYRLNKAQYERNKELFNEYINEH